MTDFLLHKDRGLPKPDDPDLARVFDGISVYDSKEASQSNARRYRRMGQYIAQFEIPATTSIRIEKTFAKPSQFTLWADPLVLVACVSSVEPARPQSVG